MNLEQYKLNLINGKVSKELENHPMFLRLLDVSFKNLEETLDYNSECKVESFRNGNTIRLSTNGTCKTTRTELRNNRDFVAATISLNDDNTISLDVANGTLFKAKDVKATGEKVKENSSCVLNTYYTHSVYDELGIELSHGAFGDDYELMGEFKKINVESHILTANAHKPKFLEEDVILPNLCENAYMEFAYRKKENLAVVYAESLNGIKRDLNTMSVENVDKMIYAVSPNYAETVGVLQEQIAKWSYQKQEYELTTYEYGTDLEVVKESLKEFLEANLEMSKQSRK